MHVQLEHVDVADRVTSTVVVSRMGLQTFQSMTTPALMTVHGAPGSDVVIIDFSHSSNTADMLFKQRGAFVMDCNHGGGAGLAADVWKFFKAHPYGRTLRREKTRCRRTSTRRVRSSRTRARSR